MSADSPFTTIAAPIDIGRAIGTPSWNGSLFTSAAPTALGFETADTGVDVSLLAPNLTLVGGPTTIVDRRLPTSGATATGLGSGKSLIAYSRLMPDADFGNVRVRFQIVDSQPAPEADGGATGGDASAPDGGTADAAVATDTAAGDAWAPSDATGADAAREAGVSDAGAADAGASDGSPDSGAIDAPRETAASSDAVADTTSERSAGTGGAGCSCASAGRDTRASGDAWILGALVLGLATALHRRRRNTWSRGSAR
jgi:MYXO-CTERM domain-containing protein